MNMELSRRQFHEGAGAGIAGTTLGAFGFGDVEAAYAAAIRPFKLAEHDRDPQHLPLLLGRLRHHHVFARATSRRARRPRSSTSRAMPTTRSIAARSARRARRCSTSCTARDAAQVSDDPQAGLRQVRARSPGTTRSTASRELMKDDRDENFIAKNNDGVTVNRWTDAPASSPRSATTNETALPDLQGRAQRRDAGLRQPGASLTRPDGVQSGPDIWPWRDDELLDRHQEHRSRRDHGRQRRRSASVRLQVGHGGQGQPRRQADRRRSALHALGLGGGLLCADPAGHGHRLPARRDQLLHRATTRSSGTTSRPTPTPPTS